MYYVMTIAKWTVVAKSSLDCVGERRGACLLSADGGGGCAAAAVIVLAFEGQCSWFQQKWQRVYLQSQIGT